MILLEDIDSIGGESDIGFLSRYPYSDYSITIRSILVQQHTTLSQRYATHFRIWFILGWRSEFFPVLERLLRDNYSAHELQPLRRNHRMNSIFPEFDAYVEHTMEKHARAPPPTPRSSQRATPSGGYSVEIEAPPGAWSVEVTLPAESRERAPRGRYEDPMDCVLF